MMILRQLCDVIKTAVSMHIATAASIRTCFFLLQWAIHSRCNERIVQNIPGIFTLNVVYCV